MTLEFESLRTGRKLSMPTSLPHTQPVVLGGTDGENPEGYLDYLHSLVVSAYWDSEVPISGTTLKILYSNDFSQSGKCSLSP